MIDTLNFELSRSIECHLEVCLPSRKILNDNSKLKSVDFTMTIVKNTLSEIISIFI